MASASAYDLSFEQGDEMIVYDINNVQTLTLIIDNTDASDYISDASEISYLNIKPVGSNENLLRLINYRDYKDNGVFIDKDVIEKIEVEFRLPQTQTWEKEYILQVAGISPDKRQKLATIKVIPSAEKETSVTDKINWMLILIIAGIVSFILAILYFGDKFGFFKIKRRW